MDALLGAVDSALHSSTVATFLVNKQGLHSVLDGALGVPEDLLAHTLHHAFSRNEKEIRTSRKEAFISCVLISDELATDLVMARQLRESDPTKHAYMSLAKASRSLWGPWYKRATRRRITSVRDITLAIKTAQALLKEETAKDFLLRRRRLHSVITLHLETSAGGRLSCVRVIGLTGMPAVCTRDALQLSHRQQDPLVPAPPDLGEGLWSLIQPVRDQVHRVWLVEEAMSADKGCPWRFTSVGLRKATGTTPKPVKEDCISPVRTLSSTTPPRTPEAQHQTMRNRLMSVESGNLGSPNTDAGSSRSSGERSSLTGSTIGRLHSNDSALSSEPSEGWPEEHLPLAPLLADLPLSPEAPVSPGSPVSAVEQVSPVIQIARPPSPERPQWLIRCLTAPLRSKAAGVMSEYTAFAIGDGLAAAAHQETFHHATLYQAAAHGETFYQAAAWYQQVASKRYNSKRRFT